MTVNEMEGAGLARVLNPGAVGGLPIRRELNGAYREVVQAIRDADTNLCDQISTLDLLADQNVYQLPDGIDTIRSVSRCDMYGQFGTEDPVFTPCGKMEIEFIQRARTFAYAIGPTGLVLWPTPPLDYPQALRILSLPIAEDLIVDTQVPQIPKQLHDCIVGRLVRRLGSLANVQLSSGVADFIATQERYLIGFLNPSGRESINRFARTKSLYSPKRF